MAGCARVFTGVPVWRTVATERDATLLTGAQVHPLRSDLYALGAFANRRLFDGSDNFDVRTNRHRFSTALSRRGECDLDAGNGHTTFADSGGTTLDRTGADIARRKNVGKTCLERTCFTLVLFPSGRCRHVGSRFDKAFFVALDLSRQPFSARVSAEWLPGEIEH